MKRVTGTLLIAAALAVGAAQADEVWETEIGTVIYEADLENGQAVWSYPLADYDDWRGKAFISGLAGVYEGRTSYSGYWIEPGSSDGMSGCPVEIRDPQTEGTSDVWGRVTLVFVESDFPSSWVALRGECFEEPYDALVGRPVTAAE